MILNPMVQVGHGCVGSGVSLQGEQAQHQHQEVPLCYIRWFNKSIMPG